MKQKLDSAIKILTVNPWHRLHISKCHINNTIIFLVSVPNNSHFYNVDDSIIASKFAPSHPVHV